MSLTIRLLFLLLLMSSWLCAQENNDAAANATNPLAFVTKMQMQPGFTWKNEKARVFNLTNRIIYPTGSIGLPFFKSKNPAKIYTIYRLEVPLTAQSYPENKQLDAVGLADMVLLDAVVFKQKWGVLGVGPAAIIPTMHPETISSGKWSVGAALVLLNTKTKGLQWGMLVQQFFNVGDNNTKQNQSFMLFQPMFSKIIGRGNFVQFGSTFNFNWTKSTYNIPVSFFLGRAFAKNLSMQAGPEYVVSGPFRGDFAFKFQINAMFPHEK